MPQELFQTCIRRDSQLNSESLKISYLPTSSHLFSSILCLHNEKRKGRNALKLCRIDKHTEHKRASSAGSEILFAGEALVSPILWCWLHTWFVEQLIFYLFTFLQGLGLLVPHMLRVEACMHYLLTYLHFGCIQPLNTSNFSTRRPPTCELTAEHCLLRPSAIDQ